MLKKLFYSLGLDLGIASVGWAVIEREDNGLNMPRRIVDLGVRCFDIPEESKTKESLAVGRRNARGMRRRIQRRAARIKKVKSLFIKYGLMKSVEELNKVFDTSAEDWRDPWQLRNEALSRILKPNELIQVLTHISKRRGFKSNTKNENPELKDIKTEGALKSAVEHNSKMLIEKGYRTIGEMIFKECEIEEDDVRKHKRNKADQYIHTVSRNDLLNEIKYIFQIQRKLGSPFVPENFESEFIDLWSYQKSFASGDDIINRIGKCSILGFTNQENPPRRAPSACFTSEYFGLLQAINNLRVIKDGLEYSLSHEEKMMVRQIAFDLKEVSYKQIRNYLKLNVQTVFKAHNIKKDKNGNADESKTKFFCMKNYHELKSAINKIDEKYWDKISENVDELNNLAYGLTVYKNNEDIKKFMFDNNFKELISFIEVLPQFSKFKHLSIEAMNLIIPHMEKGLIYSDACKNAGLDFKGIVKAERSLKLPWSPSIYEDIRNPVVLRALTQARKVVNAVVAKYGPPYSVHIELAREVGITPEKRNEIENENKKNRMARAGIVELIIKEEKIRPNGGDILKWRLWKEQEFICPYSGKPIDISMLADRNATQIDHIIPYSRSMDDSFSNKVLVMTAENQNKKNLIPYEAWRETEKWLEFERWVKESKLGSAKKAKLLKKSHTDKDAEGFIERNLNDTRYISRFFKNYIETYLKFSDASLKSPVICVSGKCTAHLRGVWGLTKNRDESDKHHALDAAVIACVDRGIIKKVTDFSKIRELNNDREERFPKPYDKFRDELLARLSEDARSKIMELCLSTYGPNELKEIMPIFVSRAPNRKVNGAAHAETLRSPKRYENENITSVKTPLKQINIKKLDDMVKDGNGEISDKALYKVLRNRLIEFNDKPEKAFANPIYKPLKDGTNGPIVRSVRLESTTTAGVLRNNRNGISLNESMVRLDVFRKKNKYHLVPIYVADMVKDNLPMKAIIAGKNESEWELMDDTFEFLFSIYKNDCILIKDKKREFCGYYASCDRATGSISMYSHEKKGKETQERLSPKTALEFIKFEVDILGNKTEIKKEVRRGLEKYNNNKSCKTASKGQQSIHN